MKTSLLLMLFTGLFFFSLPAVAFECATAGVSEVAPEDNGIASRTACGSGANASAGGTTAIGGGAVASASSSTALGLAASSAGEDSTALGRSASATGEGSTAVGRSTIAEGEFSSTFGFEARSDGNYSTAVGHLALSPGGNSTALGYRANSAGIQGVSVGFFASSEGINSIALGATTNAAGFKGTALGMAASSSGDESVAVGSSAAAGAQNSIAIGSLASVSQENAMVLGSIPGVRGATSYVDVANGTGEPLAPLHIFRDDGTAQVLVEETNVDPVPRTLFKLASAGSNAKFEIENSLAGETWAFTNSGADFRVSRQGSGIIEFQVLNNGDAVIAGDLDVGGNLTSNVNMPSDRNIKRNIHSIDPQAVLNKVAALPVSVWEYNGRPGEKHIGPMAQDFRQAFGLGADETSISVVDASGVVIASIKALAEENKELKTRLALVEAALAELLPKTAQN